MDAKRLGAQASRLLRERSNAHASLGYPFIFSVFPSTFVCAAFARKQQAGRLRSQGESRRHCFVDLFQQFIQLISKHAICLAPTAEARKHRQFLKVFLLN